MNLMSIENVRGYMDEKGIAHLNLEDVARGLGFTQQKNGVEYVRWETVNGYLADYGFSQQVGKDSFIPENIFYRLAMKAKNDAAESFQAKVADEILPSIRKHGAYMTMEVIEKTLTSPDFIIKLATQLKDEQTKRIEAEKVIESQKPKVLFADSVSASSTSILIGELAKILKQNGVDIGQNRLFEWMRENGYLISRKGTDYNMPTQKSMELRLFEIKETSVTHASGNITISKTPKVTGRGQIYFVNKIAHKQRGHLQQA